jgi:quercetin dioxygenase-like cupin family protein
VKYVRGRSGEPTRHDVGKTSGNPTTSDLLLDTLIEAGNLRVSNAVFQPGSRTWWHSHTEGQLFFIEHGRGMVASQEQLQAVGPGDLVYAPPNELHWHGAAPDSVLIYTAISFGQTEWSDEVLEEMYGDAWK